jgi:hypothetical protein
LLRVKLDPVERAVEPSGSFSPCVGISPARYSHATGVVYPPHSVCGPHHRSGPSVGRSGWDLFASSVLSARRNISTTGGRFDISPRVVSAGECARPLSARHSPTEELCLGERPFSCAGVDPRAHPPHFSLAALPSPTLSSPARLVRPVAAPSIRRARVNHLLSIVGGRRRAPWRRYAVSLVEVTSVPFPLPLLKPTAGTAVRLISGRTNRNRRD